MNKKNSFVTHIWLTRLDPNPNFELTLTLITIWLTKLDPNPLLREDSIWLTSFGTDPGFYMVRVQSG